MIVYLIVNRSLSMSNLAFTRILNGIDCNTQPHIEHNLRRGFHVSVRIESGLDRDRGVIHLDAMTCAIGVLVIYLIFYGIVLGFVKV